MMTEKQTPMMKQYIDIKKKHQNDILFFRMGDFYEMFFDDAKTASKILNIALTARQNDVPMCGIPYHAAENYIARIIKAGHRVAICEQLETTPSQGTIVKRDVVKIVTPGTVIESNLLESDHNNFLASAYIAKDAIALSFVDISTGDFFYTVTEKNIDKFRGELAKYNPREIIIHTGSHEKDIQYVEIIKNRDIPIQYLNEWIYDRDYLTETICTALAIHNLKGIGISDDMEIMSVGSVIQYLNDTQKTAFGHIKNPRKIISHSTMILDEASVSSLELVRNQQDGTKQRTLYSILDSTKTPMGKRALERLILNPLLAEDEIKRRLDLVEMFFTQGDLLEETKRSLSQIYDLERILSRFALGKLQTHNFIALKNSLMAAEEIKKIIETRSQVNQAMNSLITGLCDLTDLTQTIEKTIADDPAQSPEQGRVIAPGLISELDRLYEVKEHSKDWILKYQEEEKKNHGINTLKIKYNKILGYYIEISKGQAENAPSYYFRKQTLVNAERFTSDELQKFETDILGASDKILAIERREIESLIAEILKYQKPIQETAEAIAYIDFICSLAQAAITNNYIKPEINSENYMSMTGARHPLVEKYYTKEVFIPNDILLDSDENIIKIITGPNMSGKSTYIRTCALLQLMTQIGSFIPAESADLSVADRIFTRIGASDNISRGESTFLVEMNETANIINNATSKSLIIMDEVGRGTSTYDGLSIAWAVVEYILRYLKARTLFATHYHELTELGKKKGIKNYNVLVKETVSTVEFLHKVIEGSADKSYGVHVAKIAGLPKTIISRASSLLEKLESSEKKKVQEPAGEESEQLEIFNASNHVLIQALEKIDLNSITPIEALNELNSLKNLIS